MKHNPSLELYRALFLPRAIEERMLIALRQGRISKWFSSYGQEAVSVGTALAMHDDEWICTMHRNLGVFTARNLPLVKLFAQFQGRATGYTKGRDRSFHFGTPEHKIFGMISHLGAQLGVADGLALARNLRGEGKCVLVYTGDGGASEGDFHESLNVAAVWNLPVLIVVENNQWGLSTPSREQFVFDSFAVKGPAYGIEAHSIDGNDLGLVLETTKELAESIRQNPRPILLECVTFRMRGHEEASGTKYYPEGLIESWQSKDPVVRYRRELIESSSASEEEVNTLETELAAHVLDALNSALEEPNPVYDELAEMSDVYAPVLEQPTHDLPPKSERKIRLIDAIKEGLDQAMERHDNLVLMGQDIAEYGGVFKATDGFADRYGLQRVRNTPLCESAIVGAGVGLSVEGFKAMVEMQFSDFVTEAMTQICNQAAKLHYRWGQQADLVIRMPTGAGVVAGPFHSQSTEAWFARVPGLKVVYPSTPAQAKGLLLRAFEDPNPVLFFEHKNLYRSLEGDVAPEYYSIPLDKAVVVQPGGELTVIAYGWAVHWVQSWMHEHPEVSVELIDVVSLRPIDWETLTVSVQKTGKCIVVQEDTFLGSIGSSIAAELQQRCFRSLDAPIAVVSSADLPIPFAAELERGFLPQDRLKNALDAMLNY
jgi:2-oxoisovalerate dehydrogenase E1 component